MKIPIYELQKIFEKYPNTNFKIKNLETIFFVNKETESTGHDFEKMDDFITQKNIHVLIQRNIKEAFVLYNDDLYNVLQEIFPGKYQKKTTRLPFKEIYNICKVYHYVNMESNRKRYLVCNEDILNKDKYIQRAEDKVLINYGEQLDINKLISIRHRFDEKDKINVRFSEIGIIIFVDMRAGEGFLERFYKNSDLVTSLLGQRESGDNIVISEDIDPLKHIVTVDDPNQLLPTYKKSSAKLIIIGEIPDEKYKFALKQVKKYDCFARFMVATNIDQSNTNDFLRQVRKTYHNDNWNTEMYINKLINNEGAKNF